jgi:hypothetical protein
MVKQEQNGNVAAIYVDIKPVLIIPIYMQWTLLLPGTNIYCRSGENLIRLRITMKLSLWYALSSSYTIAELKLTEPFMVEVWILPQKK